jgi:hypothetical protein
MDFNYHDGSAQAITVDDHNNYIYWVNYVGGAVYEVMRTSYSGETVKLNITYSGTIDVTNDVFNLYVLDKGSMRIDKYLKTSLERLENVTISDTIADLVIGYGEFGKTSTFNHW